MTSFRNNGIKYRQESLTPEDVLTIMGNTAMRAEAAQADLAHITGLAEGMGLVAVQHIEQQEPLFELGPDAA